MLIYLAKYRGFCSGVKRSIRMAEKALADNQAPVYILNDIVHNEAVNDELESKGLIKVTSPDDADKGTLIISAHGVPRTVIDQAKARGLNVIDTTCPLVYKIHETARVHTGNGYSVVLYGEPKHDEIKGIVAVDPENIHVLNSAEDIDSLPEFDNSIAFISQSTRNVDKFHETAERLMDRYGSIHIENTICRATRKRQESIRELAESVELVIVVGSQTSANSNRLVEVAEENGAIAYLIENADGFDDDWLDDVDTIGITSGASTPDNLVQEVLDSIREYCEDEELAFDLIER